MTPARCDGVNADLACGATRRVDGFAVHASIVIGSGIVPDDLAAD